METIEEKDAYEELKKKYGKGNSLEKDKELEQWDKLYGDGTLSYSVYVLLDGSKPIRVSFPPYLEFNYQPFYVGEGIKDERVFDSMGVGRQQDKYCFKTRRINEITNGGGRIRYALIGHFQTKNKGKLVERKVMNTIHRSFLENSTRHYCEIPLTRNDCNAIYNRRAPVKLMVV